MASDSNQVKHWMTPNPYTCQIEDSLADARDLMAEYRCRRLPVLDESGHLIGIVSFGDLRQAARSEEHTSELQSRQYLVCRLLLEKKT